MIWSDVGTRIVQVNFASSMLLLSWASFSPAKLRDSGGAQCPRRFFCKTIFGWFYFPLYGIWSLRHLIQQWNIFLRLGGCPQDPHLVAYGLDYLFSKYQISCMRFPCLNLWGGMGLTNWTCFPEHLGYVLFPPSKTDSPRQAGLHSSISLVLCKEAHINPWVCGCCLPRVFSGDVT